MKKTFLKFLIAVSVFFTYKTVCSQAVYTENFNFPARENLEASGGWYRNGTDSPYNVRVISPGLNYAGYKGSGIGNTAALSNDPNGDLCVNTFGIRTYGNVYMSFILRVDSMAAGATEGYNICLDEEGGNTNLNTKVYVKKISATTFKIGIKKSDSTLVNYSAAVYNTNTNYLVIAKYIFVESNYNDTAKIYIRSSGVPATEPAVADAFDKSGTDVTNIGDIILTNSFIQTGLNKSSVKIDGIRVGYTWANTLFGNYFVQLNLYAFIQGLYNNVTNKTVSDTARAYLRYNVSPFNLADSAAAVIDTTGNGSFYFGRIGNATPYYLVVRHRNSIETWSKLTTIFFSDHDYFEFATFAESAYGNNLIQKGSKYCFYSGDVNQDKFIDAADMIQTTNNATNFLTGYYSTDVNGNNITDATDLLIVYNNSVNFVKTLRP